MVREKPRYRGQNPPQSSSEIGRIAGCVAERCEIAPSREPDGQTAGRERRPHIGRGSKSWLYRRFLPESRRVHCRSFTGSGFQAAIARAHFRASALSVTPGNRRRSSTAAANSPPWSKAVRMAVASASETTNISGAWERGRARTSDMQMTAADCPLARRACEGPEFRLGWRHASGDQSGAGADLVGRRGRGTPRPSGRHGIDPRPCRGRIRRAGKGPEHRSGGAQCGSGC